MDEKMIKHNSGEKITKGWHLDKRISVAHFFATFGFAIGLSGYIYGQSERITIVEQEAIQHSALNDLRFVSIDTQLLVVQQRDTEFKQEIIRRLERIEDGIDRHIENAHGND